MNILLFLAVLIVNETIAKSGGRGNSGARSSSGAHSGSRSLGGSKFHSGTNSYVHFDSSSFRSSVFGPTSNTYFRTGPMNRTLIISSPSTAIVYDNNNYYWNGYYQSHPDKNTVCEYTISDVDGELMNVTFANGTSPKSILFGCGKWESCCGMTCCSQTGNWMAALIWLSVFVFACLYGCCREGCKTGRPRESPGEANVVL